MTGGLTSQVQMYRSEGPHCFKNGLVNVHNKTEVQAIIIINFLMNSHTGKLHFLVKIIKLCDASHHLSQQPFGEIHPNS